MRGGRDELLGKMKSWSGEGDECAWMMEDQTRRVCELGRDERICVLVKLMILGCLAGEEIEVDENCRSAEQRRME